MTDRAILFFLFLLAASLPVSVAAAHFCLGALLLLWGYQWAINRKAIIRTPLDGPIAVYLSGVLAAALVGVSPTRSLLGLAALWHILLYTVAVHQVLTRSLAQRLMGVLFLAAALNGLYGIAQHLSGGMDLFEFEGYERIKRVGDQVRATGVFDHYMTFSGQMLLLGLFGTGLLLFWARGLTYFILAGTVAVLGGGLLSSWTRNAWLGLLAGLVAIGGFKGRKAFALLSVSLILAGLLLFILYPSLRTRAVSMVDLKTDESNIERIRIWGATFDMIQDHRLFGVGIGNYKAVFDQYRERYGASPHSHAHNTLLQVTAENGLIGLIAYLFVWYVFFREGIRTARGTPDPLTRGITVGAMGSLVGFHVAGLFEYNLGDSEVAMMMWWIVGLAMAARAGHFKVQT